MIKIFHTLLVAVIVFANNNATLKLNTNGHMSMIRDVIITNDKHIITASDDKTVKVWNSETGKETKKFLGEISTGSNGKVFSIALNPDETYLAVGGFLYNKQNRSYIRIYDYQTGKLIKILDAHKNVIDDLSFDQKGKYLVSSSRDTLTNIWEVSNNFTLIDSIEFKKTNSKDLEDIARINSKIIHYNNSYYIIITGFDNKIIIYDIYNKRVSSQYRLNDNAEFMDVSNNHIAVSGKENQIYIFNYKLERIHTIDSKTAPWGLSYNKSGTMLYTGSIDSSMQSFNVNNNYNLYKTYTQQYSYVIPKELDKNTVLSLGSDNFGIYFWDMYSSKLQRKIESNGKRIWSVGINNNYIGYSGIWTGKKGKGPLDTIINLNHFDITSNINNTDFKKISALNGYKTLTLNKKSPNQLTIKDYGKEIGKIIKDGTNGKYHNCYGWYKDYIISGGINGFLKIYNQRGEIIANLKGHTGNVLSVAFNGDRLVSGGDDQTIKIWDLSKLNKKPILNESYIQELMLKYHKTKTEIIQESKKIFWNGIYKEQNLIPLISIFVTETKDFVAWSPEGFFNASKNGAQYIGYHINQGPYKEAEFVTVDALYSTFYRPDLIQKALAGENLEKYAKNINIDKLLQDGLAPEVHILTDATSTDKQDMDLKVQVCPKAKGGYDNLTLLINDTPVSVIDTSRALKLKQKSKRDDCFIYDQTISLAGGVNNIGFRATNKAGNIESKPDFLEVTFDDTNLKNKLRTKLSNISASQNINDLHILAIAVNEYKDKDLTLKYSINDATEMLKTIQDVAKPLFNKVHTYKLFDKEVTKDNIKKAFKDIKSTREDVFLLYIAGHGITDEYNGNYYYIPYDFVNKDDEKAVQTQGVGQKDLMLGLSNVTALKSLVLLDTCNSGSFVEANMQKTTTNRLARATGRATISASSKSQVALEGYNGHGVFTYTLIEALKGKGYNGDDKITINELDDYVEDVLPDRTNKKWGYRQMPQSSMYGIDFNIGRK